MIEESRILITGGAGFIGSRVARFLTERGADVYVVDDQSVGTPDRVPNDASFEQADVRTDEFREVLEATTPDALVHLAAVHYVPYCVENPDVAFDVNVSGTWNVLRAARNVDSLDKLVYASSAAVYPPHDGPLSETREPAPIDVYGETKVVGEELAELFARQTGVSTVSARLFNVYGPNETNPHLVPAILEQLADGSREVELGNLTPKRDFVHVDDVSRAILALLGEFDQPYRAYNVGTGTSYSVREVVECVSDVLGEEITIRQDDEKVRESDRPHLEADVSRIRNEVGWEPELEFTEGLERLV